MIKKFIKVYDEIIKEIHDKVSISYKDEVFYKYESNLIEIHDGWNIYQVYYDENKDLYYIETQNIHGGDYLSVGDLTREQCRRKLKSLYLI